MERDGSPGSISGGLFSTKGDVAGNAGSPENISGGLFFAKGDVESIDGSPERISGGLFTARGDEEGDGRAQQYTEIAEVFPESISGDTRVFPEISLEGAAVLTSEAGEAVAKAPQNTGPTASGKESLGTWFVGNRTALMQCSYKGFAICIPPSWAKPEKHEQIGLSKLSKLICFLQERWRSVSSQDIVRIFRLKYDVCKQDTENQ